MATSCVQRWPAALNIFVLVSLKWLGRPICAGLALEVVELELLPGDAFLLCSDGLHQGLPPEALGAALALPSATLAVARLFDLALAGPARDNLSAVVIRR